jgi:hypothetical protein
MMNPLTPGADMRCAGALESDLVKGIFLFPAMHRFSMHDTKVHSLLSIVAGYPGTVIYVHFGMLRLGFREKLGLVSQFDMRYSNPVDLHTLALAFPHLHFVTFSSNRCRSCRRSESIARQRMEFSAAISRKCSERGSKLSGAQSCDFEILPF